MTGHGEREMLVLLPDIIDVPLAHLFSLSLSLSHVASCSLARPVPVSFACNSLHLIHFLGFALRVTATLYFSIQDRALLLWLRLCSLHERKIGLTVLIFLAQQ